MAHGMAHYEQQTVSPNAASFLSRTCGKGRIRALKGATAVPVVTIVTPSAPAPIITFVQVQPPSGRQLGAGMISQRGRNNQASPVTVYGSQTTKGNGSPIYNGSNNHSPSPPQ